MKRIVAYAFIAIAVIGFTISNPTSVEAYSVFIGYQNMNYYDVVSILPANQRIATDTEAWDFFTASPGAAGDDYYGVAVDPYNNPEDGFMRFLNILYDPWGGGWTENSTLWLTDWVSERGFYIYSEPVVVPIPGAAWLLGSGLLAIWGFRKKSA